MLPAVLPDIESETSIKKKNIAVATVYISSRCQDLCSCVNVRSVDLVICCQLHYWTLKVRYDIKLLQKKHSLWLVLGRELAINMSW